MSTIKYETIPADAIITLKLSGKFYESLKISLLSMCEELGPDKLLALMEKFKTLSPPADAMEHNIHTLLRLVRDIEINAKEQGLVKEVEMVSPEVDI